MMNAPSLHHLFTPLALGALHLRHRIFTSGTAAAATGTLPLADGYRARTSAGGLTICALADGHPAVQGHPLAHGISGAAQVNGWLAVTRSIHAAGGIAVARIGESLGAATGPLDEDQIDAALNAYRTAAENANDAGFDGVELAATAGTLPACMGRQGAGAAVPGVSSLPAAYGETSFLFDALQALLTAWPANRVGLGMSLPASPAAFRRLFQAVGAIDTSELAYFHLHATGSGHATYCQPFASKVRLMHRGSLIVSGHWTGQLAETAIRSGRIDAAGFHGDAPMPADLLAEWRAPRHLAAEPGRRG